MFCGSFEMVDIAFITFYDINCTVNGYTECKIAYWLWRIVPFPLFVIGLFGNLFSIIVLSKLRMRKNSTTIYLLFLAASDMVSLLFGLLPDTVYSITGVRFVDRSRIYCRTRYWVIHSSVAFSVLLLTLLTIERLLLTKAPIRARRLFTPKTSFVVCTITLFVIIFSNSHIVYGFKHYEIKEEILAEFGKELFPVLHFPCTYATKAYMRFYTRTWGVIVLLVFNFIPATIILFGNVTIATDIILRKKRLNKTLPTLRISTVNLQQSCETRTCSPVTNIDYMQQPHKQENEQSATANLKTSSLPNIRGSKQPVPHLKNGTLRPTANKSRTRSPSRMLFTMTIFFMVTSFPYTCFVVLKSQQGELKETEISRWQLLTIVVLILGWCNNAFNFFLYFMSGTLFKQEWKKIVKAGKIRFCRMFNK